MYHRGCCSVCDLPAVGAHHVWMRMIPSHLSQLLYIEVFAQWWRPYAQTYTHFAWRLLWWRTHILSALCTYIYTQSTEQTIRRGRYSQESLTQNYLFSIPDCWVEMNWPEEFSNPKSLLLLLIWHGPLRGINVTFDCFSSGDVHLTQWDILNDRALSWNLQNDDQCSIWAW